MIWQEVVSTIEISYLEEVLRSYEKIEAEHSGLLYQCEDFVKTISEDEVDKYGRSIKGIHEDMLGDQAYENEMIQQVLARSFILAVCMMIEHQLGNLCRHLQKKHNEKIALRDFRGGGHGMKSRIDYIGVVAQKKFMALDINLELLIKLRNIIVHDNGVVTKDLQNELKSKYKDSVLKPEIHNDQLYFNITDLVIFLTFAKTVLNETGLFWTHEEE